MKSEINQINKIPIGIDLGSQKSVISCIKNGILELITNEASLRETKNVVVFGKNQRLMSENGQAQGISNFKNTITYFTRLLGLSSKYEGLKEETKWISSKVIVQEQKEGEIIHYSNIYSSLLYRIGEKKSNRCINLGTRNIDWTLLEIYNQRFSQKSGGLNVFSSKKSVQRLLNAIEKQRKVLSANSEADCSCEFLIEDYDLNENLTKSQFEKEIQHILFDIQQTLNKLIKETKTKIGKIENVEIIGGGSRIPSVQEIIKKTFGVNTLKQSLNSSECIANGLNWEILKEENSSEIIQAKSIILFEKNVPLNSVNSIKFAKKNPFNVYLFYSNPPQGFDSKIQVLQFAASNPQYNEYGIKVSFKFDNNGIVVLDEAVLVEDYIFTDEQTNKKSKKTQYNTYETWLYQDEIKHSIEDYQNIIQNIQNLLKDVTDRYNLYANIKKSVQKVLDLIKQNQEIVIVNENQPEKNELCLIRQDKERLFQSEDRQVEFKNYRYPFSKECKHIILKTIVSMLNTQGGTILIGVRDQDLSVVGINLNSKQKDEIILQIVQMMDVIYPQVNEEVNIEFIPIKFKWGKWASKTWVCRISVSQGQLDRFYIIDDGKSMEAKNPREKQNQIVYVKADSEGIKNCELEQDSIDYLNESDIQILNDNRIYISYKALVEQNGCNIQVKCKDFYDLLIAFERIKLSYMEGQFKSFDSDNKIRIYFGFQKYIE
ncbi:hypothetical protein IMG5_120220 [Ichthyophthirius multifiliis]|uniref:Schlafen AlbA-2 domain-containing protein n=1 Tax=Ichthyophthirius multifiliis TaxID=5932 RepID=G0QUZ0_ICHMU|nr:hypothetical protein IMG5_120220 [Ichthyophthirius multifiliis]EGR30959.1 hypothetical protein IMG5_120220 [Ichthyophthirius multifiliis]|eukprot:XP_004032546.1 hypothetical protein IMG5_120220 [Ichthyophthirius multifiliis]